MGKSVTNLLEFLAVVFNADVDVWGAGLIDEETIRAVAREYPPENQHTLLNEIDALLEGPAPDDALLEIALRARVNYVLDESTVREWFGMIRDQLRVVIAAS